MVTLVSFLGILWSLSGTVALFGVAIPGYMVWVALAYAVVGTWLTHLVGRPLAALRFRQQRVEADFRYSLVRVRENMEGIALYAGEAEEKGLLGQRFGSVIGNWWAIMQRTKMLNALTAGYEQVAVIFPFIVAAPRYFSGAIPLGGLTQTAGAFGQVQDALSWFITRYPDLAQWHAIVERLTTFHRAVVAARAAFGTGLVAGGCAGWIGADARSHARAAERAKLLENADLVLQPGQSVVVTGRSGSGKSTLFRAHRRHLAVRPRARAAPGRTLSVPAAAAVHSARLAAPCDQLSASAEAHSREDVVRALEDAGLPQLAARLDDDENWAQQLSGGEQQRVALARALLAKPDWLFLDEATASLDPEAEAELYRTLKERLPNTTLVSIAHRPSVAAFHDRRLMLRREEGKPGDLVPGELAASTAGGDGWNDGRGNRRNNLMQAA